MGVRQKKIPELKCAFIATIMKALPLKLYKYLNVLFQPLTDIWLLTMEEPAWSWKEIKVNNLEACPPQLWCRAAAKVMFSRHSINYLDIGIFRMSSFCQNLSYVAAF